MEALSWPLLSKEDQGKACWWSCILPLINWFRVSGWCLFYRRACCFCYSTFSFSRPVFCWCVVLFLVKQFDVTISLFPYFSISATHKHTHTYSHTHSSSNARQVLGHIVAALCSVHASDTSVTTMKGHHHYTMTRADL